MVHRIPIIAVDTTAWVVPALSLLAMLLILLVLIGLVTLLILVRARHHRRLQQSAKAARKDDSSAAAAAIDPWQEAGRRHVGDSDAPSSGSGDPEGSGGSRPGA